MFTVFMYFPLSFRRFWSETRSPCFFRYQLYSYRSIPQGDLGYFNTIFGLNIALVILQLWSMVARVAHALRLRATLFSSVTESKCLIHPS